MTKFEQAVLEEVARVRSRLQPHDMSHFQFTIEASGRVQDGEVKIVFTLGEYSGAVRANSVDAAVAEYSRRHGWDKLHDGLCLPAA